MTAPDSGAERQIVLASKGASTQGSEAFEVGIVERLDCGFLDGEVHPLGLAVGPGMVRFGEPVLDAVLGADPIGNVGALIGRLEVGVTLSFTFGCHGCAVTVDPETGEPKVRRYVAYDDLGRLLEPVIATGQVHGGAAQGVGQAPLEAFRHDGIPLSP